jgi:CO/xanthine dehydrogenase Mo-binding subunit
VQRGRPQIASAAAAARGALVARAAERLGTSEDSLQVHRGLVQIKGSPRRSVSYGDLIGDRRFEVKIPASAPLKSAAGYRLVGARVARTDLASRVDGTHTYVQHRRLPNMLHARVVRPRGQTAYGAGARVLAIDDSALANIPGARVVRRGDFVGVVAPREWDAVRAAQLLKVTWDEPAEVPGTEALHEAMRRATTIDNVVQERGDVTAASGAAATTIAMQGHAPYQSHAPFAPNCALADITAAQGLVICSSQDVYALRRSLSQLIGLPQEKLRVQFAENAGTYGHSCYDDVAQAAALLSLLAGAPVRLQFMRWDEHGWDTYGPPHVGEARVATDSSGRIVAYEYHGWQHNWSQVETSTQLAGVAAAAEWPPVGVQGVNPLVCGGMYDIANLKLVNHRVPALDWLRAGWLRSPLDLAFAFVSEQAIDQCAVALGTDPLEFRRNNIRDARWRGVLDAAAEAAGWSAPRTPSYRSPDAAGKAVRRGRGVGLGTHLVSYGAAVADVEVDMETGRVRILKLTGALDAGFVVNPLIVEHQIEGQLVQTASRMLLEEVTIGAGRVTSLDWQGYPILRMADCPDIQAVVVQRTGERSTGAGEETMAAAAAAIANAFFDATGQRMQRFPFLPERVLAALRRA